MDQLVMLASLHPGSRRSWLPLLAAGWAFADPFTPGPMLAHHGRHSVLLVWVGGVA